MTQELIHQSEREVLITTIIEVWLQNLRSARTSKTYKQYIHQFRSLLQSTGYDLDGYPATFGGPFTPDTQDKAFTVISMAAQGWASVAAKKEKVSDATINQRLSALSSFYTFAKKRRFLHMDNPIEVIDRPKIQEYAAAAPLLKEDVTQVLNAIDRSTLAGKRDYALLLVLISTGRRASEVLGLQWKHVRIAGEKIILHFERCKGGTQMYDTLDPRVKRVLIAYLTEMFPQKLATLDKEQYIWLSLAHQHYKQPLTLRGLADIFKKRMKAIDLDTMKIHTTRHTYAYNSAKSGANLLDIQKRLGHKDASTTSRYLESLSGMDNKHVSTLLDFLEVE